MNETPETASSDWNLATTGSSMDERSHELFLAHQRRIYCQTDRLFVVLMLLQWVGGVIMAMIVSPRTWIGATPYVHVHVWAAVILGGVLSSAPVYMGLRFPGAVATRHVIALSQAIWSALLIHFSGGRIETHFHVFGSLAFLAFYRDWKVLVTATVVVAADHFIRGFWYPQSVYGVFLESPYRWIEHAAWVLFEDVILIFSCIRGQNEGRLICERRAALELTNQRIEQRVRERTQQLEDARLQLEIEFKDHRKTQEERERLYSELAAASRQAGMAEVATGVLHNVGNVLNSVNVSTFLLIDKLKSNRVSTLRQACDLLVQNRDRLGDFMQHDPRGAKLVDFLDRLAQTMAAENKDSLEELSSLQTHVEHIKQIVSMQQSFAAPCSLLEPVDLGSLVDQAVKINDASLLRHEVKILREFDDLPNVITDKHKVMQILINLIKNAKQAVAGTERERRWILLRIESSESGTVHVSVSDNGVGISPENLEKIFTHGFTTKKSGHGFGLHSGAIMAKELGGQLSVHSDGVGRGATFTLELPARHMPSTESRYRQPHPEAGEELVAELSQV
jgi:signal transduction histidine kinase